MKYLILLSILFLTIACNSQRPDGPEAEEILNSFNYATQPLPDGNPSELYFLLSKDAIAQLEADIQNAKTLDSAALRELPKMEMLRVLSWKNAFAEKLRKIDDLEGLIPLWFSSAKREFPLNDNSPFIYTPDASLEDQMLEEGLIRPQVLLVKEDDMIKVNPFNTKEYQEKRLDLILKRKILISLSGRQPGCISKLSGR